MLVKDVMTGNVIAVPSGTPILEAERILEERGFLRLPVIDKDELVGIVTRDDLLNATPPAETPVARREVFYILGKMTVGEVMKKEVVTVTPDITIEHAVAIAQKNRVGSVLVVEGRKVVGIVTTNDIIFKIVNPLFGIGEDGTRIIIYGAGEAEPIQKVIERVAKLRISVKAVMTIKLPEDNQKSLILHLETEDASQLISQLKEAGFSVEIRDFRV